MKELLQDASQYYDNNNIQIAVEKLWDAFERLKTYYAPVQNKKNSVNKIIDNMSNDQPPFRELFETEFKALTKIGNDFRIRHHENTKIDIKDSKHLEYLYKRCLTLISTAVLYINIEKFQP